MLSPWKHGPELLSLAQPTRSSGWLECQGCPVALVGGGGGTFIKSSGGERIFLLVSCPVQPGECGVFG